MLKILLVSPDEKSLSDLASALKEHDDVELLSAESGKKALGMALDNTVDLVVTDEGLGDMTGLDLAGRLVSLNPMINCAAVSGLPKEEFHAASEGLGLMDQLSIQPGEEDAEKLLRNLRHIKGALRND